MCSTILPFLFLINCWSVVASVVLPQLLQSPLSKKFTHFFVFLLENGEFISSSSEKIDTTRDSF